MSKLTDERLELIRKINLEMRMIKQSLYNMSCVVEDMGATYSVGDEVEETTDE